MAEHQQGGEQPISSNIFSMLMKRRRMLEAGGQPVGPTTAGPNAPQVSQEIGAPTAGTPNDDIFTAMADQIESLKKFLGLRKELDQERPNNRKQ